MDELKELVHKQIAISEDTNRIVHGMRNTARWGRFMRIIWWAAIIGLSAASWLYLQPYLMQVQALYQNVQSGAEQAQGFQGQISDFFKQLTPNSQ